MAVITSKQYFLNFSVLTSSSFVIWPSQQRYVIVLVYRECNTMCHFSLCFLTWSLPSYGKCLAFCSFCSFSPPAFFLDCKQDWNQQVLYKISCDKYSLERRSATEGLLYVSSTGVSMCCCEFFHCWRINRNPCRVIGTVLYLWKKKPKSNQYFTLNFHIRLLWELLLCHECVPCPQLWWLLINNKQYCFGAIEVITRDFCTSDFNSWCVMVAKACFKVWF